MQSCLIIEPDRAYAKLLRQALRQYATVHVVETAQAAIDYIDNPKRQVSILVTELFLGDRSGVEVIHELRSYNDWLDLPAIIHSRTKLAADFYDPTLLSQYGIVDVIQKGPNSLAKLAAAITAKVTV